MHQNLEFDSQSKTHIEQTISRIYLQGFRVYDENYHVDER